MKPLKRITVDLSVISVNVVDTLLLDSSTDPSILDDIAIENVHRPEILNLFLTHPLTPEDTREFAARTLKLPVTTETTKTKAPQKEYTREKTQDLLQRVKAMGTGEKMQLAVKGSREIRSILLLDPRKEIMVAVVNNPNITPGEIELLAKHKTTPTNILREIAGNRTWLRSYSIVHCLVTNPKTPIGISLKHIHTIRTRDLKLIEKDRNLPEAVRNNAKKLLIAKK